MDMSYSIWNVNPLESKIKEEIFFSSSEAEYGVLNDTAKRKENGGTAIRISEC